MVQARRRGKEEMMIPIEWRTDRFGLSGKRGEKNIEEEEEDMERGAKTAAKILKWHRDRGAFLP